MALGILRRCRSFHWLLLFCCLCFLTAFSLRSGTCTGWTLEGGTFGGWPTLWSHIFLLRNCCILFFSVSSGVFTFFPSFLAASRAVSACSNCSETVTALGLASSSFCSGWLVSIKGCLVGVSLGSGTTSTVTGRVDVDAASAAGAPIANGAGPSPIANGAGPGGCTTGAVEAGAGNAN